MTPLTNYGSGRRSLSMPTALRRQWEPLSQSHVNALQKRALPDDQGFNGSRVRLPGQLHPIWSFFFLAAQE